MSAESSLLTPAAALAAASTTAPRPGIILNPSSNEAAGALLRTAPRAWVKPRPSFHPSQFSRLHHRQLAPSSELHLEVLRLQAGDGGVHLGACTRRKCSKKGGGTGIGWAVANRHVAKQQASCSSWGESLATFCLLPAACRHPLAAITYCLLPSATSHWHHPLPTTPIHPLRLPTGTTTTTRTHQRPL